MMLNHKHSVFFIVAIIAVLLLVGYISFSATQTQDPKEKAFEVARDACGIFRKMGIEQVDNSEAVLETWGESTVYKVWVVQLTGTWQLVVTPVPTIETSNTPDSSVLPSEWLIVCEVSISSKDWHVIGTKQTRTKISP
jgi:hypothetical protein